MHISLKIVPPHVLELEIVYNLFCSYFRCIFNCDKKAIDLSTETSDTKEMFQKNMMINVYKNGQWGSFRHVPLTNGKNVKMEFKNVRNDLLLSR